MKFEEMKKTFNEIIQKNLSAENKRRKLEPLFVKHKHFLSVLYKGFYAKNFSYNITKEAFTKKIVELLKKEYNAEV